MREYSPCAICGRPSVHTHHRKLRSQGGDNSEVNLIRLCLSHHSYIHANPTESYENGWLVKSFDDPALIPVLTEGVGPTGSSPEAPAEAASLAPSVSPGEKCPTCDRRVNHPKKSTSPTTKVFSVRVPLDALESWEIALDAAAEHLGIGTKAPHHRFQTLNAGLALILQAPKGLLE